jgi:hypothetical protein
MADEPLDPYHAMREAMQRRWGEEVQAPLRPTPGFTRPSRVGRRFASTPDVHPAAPMDPRRGIRKRRQDIGTHHAMTPAMERWMLAESKKLPDRQRRIAVRTRRRRPSNPEVRRAYREWRDDTEEDLERMRQRYLAEEILDDSASDDEIDELEREQRVWAAGTVQNIPKHDFEDNWFEHRTHIPKYLGDPTYRRRRNEPPKEPPKGVSHGGRVRSGPGAPPQGRSLTQ